MKKVLLVLSPQLQSDEVVEIAVKKAKDEKAMLVALYLLETGTASEAFDTFSDIGFIGDRPSAQVSEAIMKEMRQRGYEELGRVQIKAMEEGVAFEPLMEDGEPVSVVLSAIESMGITTAVLVKKKRRAFFKYFSSTYADEIAGKAPCEVLIFTDSQEPTKEE